MEFNELKITQNRVRTKEIRSIEDGMKFGVAKAGGAVHGSARPDREHVAQCMDTQVHGAWPRHRCMRTGTTQAHAGMCGRSPHVILHEVHA